MFKTLFSAIAARMAARAARTLRPSYEPVFLEPGAAAAADRLVEAYQQRIQEGYLVAHRALRLAGEPSAANQPAPFQKSDVTTNFERVRKEYDQAASDLDPDGLATEIVRLFCLGVPGMADLDTRRRIVMAWSAILAPSIVMRGHSKRPIELHRLVDLAEAWVRTGTTQDARDAYEIAETRFVASHPARMYDLAADSAAAHKEEHARLIASLIQPVVFSVGEYLGAVAATGQAGASSSVLDAIVRKAK